VQKDGQSLLSDLNRFKAGVQDLQGIVNDPSNILGGVFEHLNSFVKAFEERLNTNQPSDDIQLKPEHAPNTEDNNIIYVDPNIDSRNSVPHSNPVVPPNWNKQQDISLGSSRRSNPGGDDYNGSLHNSPLYDSNDYAGPGLVPMQSPTENAFPTFSNGVRGTPSGYPPPPQRTAPQPALPVQNLTTHVLRMKGVPEAGIAAAINDPVQMQYLLNQLYGPRSMITSGDDGGDFGSRAGQGFRTDQPDPASTPAATPDTYLPFGWAGLPPLPR
jgi:hypothetical protein